MSTTAEESQPTWFRPPPEEWEEDSYTFAPEGANLADNRIRVRMVTQEGASALIEFAVIQQTYDRGSWRYVVAVDSCHDSDVHLHRYSRRTAARVGEPEVLMPVCSMSDLQLGYDLAYTRVIAQWADNLPRWRDLG